ncbi:TPA: hypothetical protein ACSPKR_000734 [Providencia rettgeri]
MTVAIHHHVSLRYFGHLRLARQPDEITPLYGGIASIKKATSD